MRRRYRDDPDEIAADLAADRAALADTLAQLRNRLNPSAVLAEGAALLRRQTGGLQSGGNAALSALSKGAMNSKATPWVAGAAVAGLALAYWSSRSNAEPEALPQWLKDIRSARARADDLHEQIAQAYEEGILPESELEQAAQDVDRALELDSRRALLSGLEGLDREERDAALAVREARLADRPKGFIASHPVLTGVLTAGAAAGAAALYKRWDEKGTDGLLAEAKSALDMAIKRLDQATHGSD